jgi:predicted lipase
MSLSLLDLAILCRMSYNTDENSLEQIIQEIHVLDNKDTDTHVLLCTSKDTLIITVRGTRTLDNWLDNLDFSLISVDDSQIEFHKGFYEQCISIYSDIKQYITKDIKKIHLNGHSTGGCISSILGYLLVKDGKWNRDNIKITTFGAPVFTNRHGVGWYNKTDYYRVQYYRDPIPRILNRKTIFIDYRHVSKTLYFIGKYGNVIMNPKISNKWYEFVIGLVSCHLSIEDHSIHAYIENIVN